jgi:hypothetical protein
MLAALKLPFDLSSIRCIVRTWGRSTPTRLKKAAFGESEAVMVASSMSHSMVVTANGEQGTFGDETTANSGTRIPPR